MTLAELSPAEAEAWRRRVNRDALGCGCREGAASLMGGLVTLLGAGVAWPGALVRHPVKSGLLAIAFLAACALAGKAIGLMLARVRLAYTLRSVTLTPDRRTFANLTQ
jgi:hypothetical protein